MIGAAIAAAGITVLAIFSFLAEGDGLAAGHVRVRTQILNILRWAIVITLSWALIPTAFVQPGSDRAATVIGLALLIGATMLIPVRWFVQLGGRQPTWELRRAKVELGVLTNRIRRDKGTVPTVRLRETIDRIEAIRAPDTVELCDLMIWQLDDLIAGRESWNEAGRRSLRIDELSRELWPDDMPPPEHEPDEATFRWHLYRLFGRLMEIGATDLTPDSRAEYRALLGSIDEFRRDDTLRFIDAVCRSTDRWLANHVSGRPWIAGYDFEALGPGGLGEVRAIWGRDATMWGAHLDDDDLRALEEDLARRAESKESAAEEPAAEPAEPAEPDESAEVAT
jgi:hypothetical protein